LIGNSAVSTILSENAHILH